ncbi:MAG TPA: hypothetical protein VEL74_11680 [Thermoanaerobaculia bacterium]|nr:hypothetical protein [Thermoanaerobaculia bacterium]
MSDQKSRPPLGLELWTLKEWTNHRQAPFDLKKDNFSVAWHPTDGGYVQFRLVGGGDHEHEFKRHTDGCFRGELKIGKRQFEFSFVVTGTTPGRLMKGEFYEISKETGPDPVASWGAEERGGGPIIGHEGHGRGERRPEPPVRR